MRLLWRRPEISADRVLAAVREHLEGRGEVLKDGPRGRVTAHAWANGQSPMQVVLKAHGRKPWPGFLPCWGGRRAWAAGRAFEDRGLPTPRVLAYLERRGFPQGQGFLLCERVPGSRPMHEAWTHEIAGKPIRGPLRRAFTRALAAPVAALLAAGIYHPDLSAKNILVSGEPGRWSFHFIDLDGVWMGRPLNARRRAKNLAQLAHLPLRPSAADCMRFLTALEQDRGQRRADWRAARPFLDDRYKKAPCEGWA